MQNNDPKAVYLIISGMANRESTQDGEVVIQHSRALAGDWLGLANIISKLVPYMHSAIAADTSEVLSFNLQQFAVLRSNQEFDKYLLQVVGKEQLAEEARFLNNFSSSRSYDKLIRFLAAEMSRQQKPGFLMIQKPHIVGTQQYLADAIGTTRETVSRDLQPLIMTGIIERSHGIRPIGYTILKEAELKALADSPMRRSAFYKKVQCTRLGRRFSDVA
jgi:CRP-like cAMP-binding protein